MANGTLKVSNIQTSSGSGTITIGQSGETIAGIVTNTPSFQVKKKISIIIQTYIVKNF